MSAIAQLSAALAGRYEIDREIGTGGMATVYLARDIRHERHVALKVLSPELGAVLGAERFLSEIRVTANLQHPNLLPLFDSGEANGLLFYVMPFVDGETLRARLDREKQLPIDDAVRIATALGSALAYAHEHGVIHRDLKPENILIQAGQPVIADFGIALAVSKAGGARVTQTGLSLGTPQYMSPEQAAGDRTIDGRSDIYSLGAVTYEMLAGEPPHSGTSAQAIIAKLMTQDPQPLRSLRPSVPAHVADAVEKSLCKLPADRFSTAAEFVAALANPAFATTARTGTLTTRTSRRVRALAYGSSAIAGMLLLVIAWMLTRPTPAPTPPRPVIRYQVAMDTTQELSRVPQFSRVALSPDGSRLVYVGGPRAQLLLRLQSQLSATALPGTDDAVSPFFSPDGEHVGFMQGRVLRIASLGGGAPITVTDTLLGVSGAAWAPDGFIYADGWGPTSLVRVAAKAGALPTPFTTLDSASGETDHYSPAVLPDGTGVLFTVAYRTVAETDVAIIGIADRAHSVVLKRACCARYGGGQLLYVTSAGTLMAVAFDAKARKVTGEPRVLSEGLGTAAIQYSVAVSALGTLAYVTRQTTEIEPVWVTRNGNAQPVDSAFHGDLANPSLSPDGTQLAIRDGTATESEVWVKQLDTGPRVRLTFEKRRTGSPAWTPDGRSVTYSSNVSGTYDLWTKRADGSAAAALQQHYRLNVQESLWSPDGKWLVFRTGQNQAGAGDILAVRPGVDTAPAAIVATAFAEYTPALSPDGRWLAYSSNETGAREVYVVPFPNSGTAKWAVSTQGGTEPLWAHSGRELFYRNGAGSLVSVQVSASPTFTVGRTTPLFDAAGFSASAFHQQYAVARDDKRFLMLRPRGKHVADKLIVVENWLEELKRKPRQ